jgi:hypothetical protein
MSQLVEWQRPELTVLVRNNPEEMVLTQCKTNAVGPEPGTIKQNCGYDLVSNCRACQARGGGDS